MSASRKVIKRILLSQLIAPPQVREWFDEEGLNTLAATMRIVGQLQPIHVTMIGDKYRIDDGGRRFLAAPRAGFDALDAVVSDEAIDDIQLVHKQVVANGQRQDLNPIETAKAIRRLMEARDCPASAIAASIGVSNAMATRLLATLKLSAEEQALVAVAKISLSAAYELARMDDPEQRAELAQRVASGALTRDGVAEAVKAARKGRTKEGEARKSRATAALSDGRAVTVSGQDLDLESFITAMEEALTKARRARTQGVELTTFVKMLGDQSR